MFRGCSMAAIISLTSLVAQADVIKATLYPSHAEVTWQEIANVSVGDGILIIEGLPVSLQDQSVRVALEGVSGAVIKQVEIKREEKTDYVDKETLTLRNQLMEIQDQIRIKEDAITAWEKTVTLMSGAAKATHESTASELNDISRVVRESTLEALTEIRVIRNKMRADLARRDQLERQINQVAQNMKATKKVLIQYHAAQAGTLNATVEFQTTDANWRSEYSARLKTGIDGNPDGELLLEHQAVVSQGTGIDWRGVELRLSTANTYLGTAMPAVNPWVISIPKPVPKESAYRELASGMVQSMGAELANKALAKTIPQSAFTQHYEIQHPVDVPSDKSGHRLTVSEYRFPVEVATWVAPTLNTTAYLHVTGTFKSDAPIPAGAVMLYRDGQSVGQSIVPTLADGETFSLGFGVDDGLRVAVVNEIEKSGQEGVWKSENVLRRQNRFDITNHHHNQVRVKVFDRLPVSQQDKLTIEPLEISVPVEKDVDDKKSVMAWTRVVPPGETIQIKSGFELRTPKDVPLPPIQ